MMKKHWTVWIGVFSAISWLGLSVGGAAESKVVQPFNGRNLEGWMMKGPKERSQWAVGRAEMDLGSPEKLKVHEFGKELINGEGQGVDLFTVEKFGDVRVELEVMVPTGSNSGIYLMGEYEVQVFDSYGKRELGGGDMGAIYGAAPPPVNASEAPGRWQKFVIEFRAPRFSESGEKRRSAKFLSVTLNGKLLHRGVEVKGPTTAALTGKEAATGPLMLQGDHGPVAYRNIRIMPLD